MTDTGSSLINAAGKMTALGATAVQPEVAAAVADALQQYVEVAVLEARSGRRTAEVTGAEAGTVVASATAGLVLSTAACVAGRDPRSIELLPDSEPPNEVVILQSHLVHWGMPITQAVRMGGGHCVPVGTVNRATVNNLRAGFTSGTAAAMYVVSHHVNAEGSLPIHAVLEEAHARAIPVIVDAAAEMDLRKYVAAGADLVVYSGQKAIGGPTSGIVVGRRDLVEAIGAHREGIGRAMKVSKEAIQGLMAAVDLYVERDEERELQAQRERSERLRHLLGTIPGGTVDIAEDETRPISRVELSLADGAPMSAADLVRALKSGTPSIHTRNHHVAQGTILFDPRTLRDGEEIVVARRVRAALGLEGT